MYPDNLNPNPAGVPDGPPAGRKARRKWLAIIIAAIVAIVVIAGVIIFVVGGNKGEGDTGGGDVYYDREGFDRSQLSDAIGDPAPLVTRAGTGGAAAYKGTGVVQACNVLTVEDIRKLSLELIPHSTAGIERNYIDGQSQGDTRSFPTSLASGDDSNSCQYTFYKPEGTGVTIEIYQPAYNAPSAIDYELSRLYKQSGSVGDYAQYVREVEGRKYFFLRDGSAAVLVSTRNMTDDQLSQKIVAAVAANYKREAAAPKAPLRFAYDTPVFKKTYLNGCEAVTAADAATLFGGPAKPFVREQVATATGVIQYNPDQPDTRFSDIRHTCTRQAVSNGYSNKKSLTIESESFLSAKAAEMQMASGRQLDDGVMDVPAPIGDDAYFSQTTGDNPELTVRKGRFVLSLGLLDQTQPNMTDQQMIEALTPVAKAAVARMKD